MSGIAGIVFFDQTKVQQRDLEKMKTALAHRGTDGANLFFEENVGLIHLMLHVSPESIFETQPFSTQNKIITADARIDNREELIEKLFLKPAYAPVITDSEIILAAYNFWGEDCLFHFIGDFAFAIWDATKQQLFCGRDHSGVRPFYYYHIKGEVFAFASEIKALLALDFVPKILNNEKIALYLCWLSDNRAYKESTFYEQIVSLQPAFSLKVDKENIDKKFCWDFNLERFSHLKTEEDFVNAFREHFIEAVRCRTRTSFGIASHLSGGLDSSSIVCVANLLSEKPITTLHDVTGSASTDEREYAEAVLVGKNINHFWVKPEGEYFETLNKINTIFDRPEHYNAPCQKLFSQSKIINQQECKVLLTGLDGDTVVGHGTDILFDYLEQQNFTEFEIEIKNFAEKIERVSYAKDWQQLDIQTKIYVIAEWRIEQIFVNLIKTKQYFKAIKLVKWAKKTFKIGYFEIFTHILNLLKMKILGFFRNKNKSYPYYISENISLNKPINTLIKEQFIWNVSVYNRKFLTIYSAGFTELIEEYNHIGSAFSYEVTHPFFDKRLIELCLTIPKKYIFSNGLRRGILRKSMIGILPEKVRLRATKVDFTDYVFDSIDEIKVNLKEYLYKNQSIFKPYINYSELLECSNDIIKNKVKSKSYRFLNHIGRSIYLISWLNLIKHEKKESLH